MINLYPLYIDPGTGSILFSVLVGAAATLYFLLRALILKLKVILSGGRISSKANYKSKFVIYCEGKQYWNVFKPIVEEFEQNKTELRYLTSSTDDPVFDISWEYIKPEYIGEGNKAYAFLNFISAEIVLMTTAGLQVYQLKRSKTVKHYSHVLHSTADITTYRLFGLDYFDSIFLTGDFQAADVRFLENQRGLPEKQLITSGCTYLDAYSEKIKQIEPEEDHPFTVLVSPSWGASALLSRYGEKLLDPLRDSHWRIIIRPHPQSQKSEAEMLRQLQTRYKDCANILWDTERENIYSLSKADIMISDFSGIIFDYMFLRDRPVLYVNQDFDPRPYDADDLDHELWQFTIIKEAGIELRQEDFPNITEVIKNAGDSGTLAAARKKARETAWQYPGEAGKRIFDFMINVEEKCQPSLTA
ncbi:MAG: CDP-glycerol glycerophosphotransferase family protein [Treponema sp.]|jgi:hypothetical protein|nr:CDP-glycerol glycerophosphotransferase family protein [Treponema sp.]